MCSVPLPKNKLRFHSLNVILIYYNVCLVGTITINWGVVIETFYSKMPSKCTRNVVGPLSKDIKKIRNLFTSFILKNPQIYH